MHKLEIMNQEQCHILVCAHCRTPLSNKVEQRDHVKTGLINSNDFTDGIDPFGIALQDECFHIHFETNIDFYEFDMNLIQSCCCGPPPGESLNLKCKGCGVNMAREVSECCFFNYIRIPRENVVLVSDEKRETNASP